MSLVDIWALLFPQWLQDWIRFQLLVKLGLNPQQFLLGVTRGMFDTLLLLLISMGVLVTGQKYMETQYELPPDIQGTVLKWAPIADQIGRQVDIPREVPLVIWFKENSMRSINPDLCSGIIGAYDLIQSGTRPCFTPGPISDIEVREQLAIGAQEFKKRCPEITYYTQDPTVIKRCYFAYNAGMGAAATLDANESAYVMNNYDEAHQNMVYQDIVLGTVRVTQLGAWPTHIAMQSLITSQLDLADPMSSIALLDTMTRVYDWLNFEFNAMYVNSNVALEFPEERSLWGEDYCLVEPSEFTASLQWRLRPNLNPVTENPILTQDIHGCSYALPGIDISSSTNRTAVLQAPMSGEITTYTDQWYNSTIRIENDNWVVYLLHPRSYLVSEGTVARGQAIGIMGAVGNATGPHVHYTIYDKDKQAFVDPAQFLPQQ
jgi:hypothetical protein